MPNFLMYFFKAAMEAKVFLFFARGQIMLLRDHQRGEIYTVITTIH
jgi:hypothetical protein